MDDAETFYDNWYRDVLIISGEPISEVPRWSELTPRHQDVWNKIRANVQLATNTIGNLQEALERKDG